MSRSITLSGQCAILWVEKWINKFLNNYFHTENVDYCITIDTDSVTGDTDIIVNGSKIKIKDYYDSISDENFIRYDDFNHDYIKYVSNNDKSLSLFDNDLYEGKIKYIMKHRVKKEMFEISINNKSVIVTEDHSIIVERNNNIISVNPKNILKNDKIIFI